MSLEDAARRAQGPALVTLKPQSRVLTQFDERRPATAEDVDAAAKEGVTLTLGQPFGSPGISNVIVQAEIEWILTGERESAEIVLFIGNSDPQFAPSPKVDEQFVMLLTEGGTPGLYSYDPMFFEYDPATTTLTAEESMERHPIGAEFSGRPVDVLRTAASKHQWQQ